MNSIIYLDYAATTPIDPRVAHIMAEYLTQTGIFGNPASLHRAGKLASEAIETARRQVAALLGVSAESIIWTSGATEANNLAIKGVASFYQRQGKHIITAQTEHRAVLDSCQALSRQGFEITYLKPNSEGLILIEDVKSAIRNDTILVSLMMVNNETGVVQDIEGMGRMIKSMRPKDSKKISSTETEVISDEIIFHVDAAQAVGKIPIDLSRLNVDLMSFSAHKVYGPKGIGALYIRTFPKIRLLPQMDGGGQERGYRSGTLATHQCVGMGEAFSIAEKETIKDRHHVQKMRDIFWENIHDLPGVFPTANSTHTLPHILSVCFSQVEKDKLLSDLDILAISSGSACTGLSIDASHVLRAMGLRNEWAHRTLRISFGRFTTEEEVNHASSALRSCYLKNITGVLHAS